KDHLRQPIVAQELANQVAAGAHGVVGVMLESFLVAGRQDLTDPAKLVFGQSVTDSCMDVDTTATVLETLASAVRQRRAAALAATAGAAAAGAVADG
ncbi:MAG: hypothetical protein J2P27_09370, partial [Actinobacteria bacterium]|nr:hypothetical protein [Actinomycetota bacterium]